MEDSIKIDLKETGLMMWTGLFWLRIAGSCGYYNETLGPKKVGNFCMS
jgi:hypothetical protein